jgi:hypothetical protein
MEKGSNRMNDLNVEIHTMEDDVSDALDGVNKETSQERAARRDREDRRWNRQWALDKSIEWCKHINELVSAPNNDVSGVIMTSSDVHTIANNFYEWLYEKETKV